MQNVSTAVKGNILTITVDLSKRNGVSKSGKSETIATTSGNASLVHGDQIVKFGLNVYVPTK